MEFYWRKVEENDFIKIEKTCTAKFFCIFEQHMFDVPLNKNLVAIKLVFSDESCIFLGYYF